MSRIITDEDEILLDINGNPIGSLNENGLQLGGSGARINSISTDNTLSGASNTNTYTGLAFKTYIDRMADGLIQEQVVTTPVTAITFTNLPNVPMVMYLMYFRAVVAGVSLSLLFSKDNGVTWVNGTGFVRRQTAVLDTTYSGVDITTNQLVIIAGDVSTQPMNGVIDLAKPSATLAFQVQSRMYHQNNTTARWVQNLTSGGLTTLAPAGAVNAIRISFAGASDINTAAVASIYRA